MQSSARTPAEKRPRVAIVDDDPDVRFTLEALLHENGFDAVPLAGSKDYFDLGTPPNIDLVLIDLKLNGESGLSLAINVREQHDIPIVMLTGVGDEVDKIVGLETGADDYLTKPFNPRELIARIRAVLRRCGVLHSGGSSPQAPASDALRFGDKLLDRSKRELLNTAGEEIPLTNAEYRLLEFFLRNPNRVIPRAEMLSELGNDLSQYVDRTIDVLILRLRRKIESVPSKPVHLQTRRGQGYIFVDHPGHTRE
ncbi:response regulator [Pelagibius sp. Alg239-R121]|uniref:response regulator n=1 Tax=Pelagibius sp. Alg239-R121 TaxID=2993448 RepID=UPI0024A62CE2|nr:response regulator transcription factor [Pelagibius sp. Alg239-R121]